MSENQQSILHSVDCSLQPDAKKIAHSANRFNNFFRAHAYAWNKARRLFLAKPAQTLKTTGILAIAFAALAMLWLLGENLADWQPVFKQSMAITLYLKPAISDSQSRKLAEQLSVRPDVSQVRYISPAEGLEELKNRLKIPHLLLPLEENPLPGVIVVRPAMPLTADTELQQLAENLQQQPAVATVQWDQGRSAQLAVLLRLLTWLAYVLAGLWLTNISGMIYYVMRAVLLPDRNELRLYKSLGAPDVFIRRPFLYASCWYGVSGAAGSILLIIILQKILASPLQEFIQSYGNLLPLKKFNLTTSVLLLFVGAFLSWASAWVILSKELAIIQRSDAR